MSALASILPATVAIPAQIDPALIDACGEDPGNLCEWVYDRTGNETLAKLSDWLVGTPLTVLCIVIGAWILAHLARRYLGRVVREVMLRQNSLPARQLSRVGIGDGEQVDDPRLEARAASISGVVGGTAGVIIWVIALITVLGEIGVDLGPLIAGAGIAGVALGFGAQNIVKDFLAGLFVLIEDQYGIGDTVDLGEASGTVQQISLRTTVLRAQDGTVWHVPNGEVMRVGNKSQIFSVAIVDVTVAYSSDIDKVKAVIQRTATQICESEEWRHDVLEPPDLLGVEAFASIGVTVRTLVKTTPGKQWALQRALRESIKSALDDAGIEIPAQRL
ncbi:MAG: mechanosensitive ion channel family protein [Ilumatobacteraceae bacterium]